MDIIPINWQLVSNPINWAIIILMLLFASFLAHLVLPQFFNSNPNS